MTYKIAIFCPDQHILYDLNTLNKTGVGGGITVRIRIAHALAALGHQVKLFVNCPIETNISGVEYHHFSTLKEIDTDIFIASTSGGALDLSCLGKIRINAGLRILSIHGTKQPTGLEFFPYDFIYAPSNFLGRIIRSEWEINPEKIFITQRGIEELNYAPRLDGVIPRDPFSLIYAGHPSKWLEAALAVLRILRQQDPRFSLHVYGGYQLWGQNDELVLDEEGVEYHGLVGQQELALKMMGCGFSLNLQARQEPFGVVVAESMRAGCIVLASPVGAYPEILSDGFSGFFVAGDHTAPSTHEFAAGLIQRLVQNPDYLKFIRRNAAHSPLNWDVVAQTWVGHWNWLNSRNQSNAAKSLQTIQGCGVCNGEWLMLADGLHCINCGQYRKSFA